jgi:predicted transcriptional regulator of viral defense system
LTVERLYADLYGRQVFTLDEAVEAAEKLTDRALSRPYVSSKYLNPLVKSGKLARARHGLFVVASPGNEPIVDKLLLASKIRKNGFLGFHSALEFYGCAYSATSEAYVCVEPNDRFRGFSFGGYSFKPVFVEDAGFEVVQLEYRGQPTRVSGKERLFLDCISRPKYAGGWEECLKSLEGLGGIDFERLLNILEGGYGGQSVARRAGLVLEMLRGSSVFYRHLTEDVLTGIEKLVGGGRNYLIPGRRGRLVKRWGLIVPDDFQTLLTAV